MSKAAWYALLLALLHTVSAFAKVPQPSGLSPASLTSVQKLQSLSSAVLADDIGVDAISPWSGKAAIPLLEDKRNMWSKISFAWAQQLMVLGAKKQIEVEDLWKLDDASLLGNVSATFNNYFDVEKSRMNATIGIPPSLHGSNVLLQLWSSPIIRALAKMYRAPLILSGIMKFFNTAVQFLPSMLIAKILKNVDKQTSLFTSGVNLSDLDALFLRKEGILLAVSLFLVLCSKTFLENQYFNTVINMGANVRGALSTAIYSKSLRLSPSGRSNNTIGEIVNYMQLDTNRMEQLFGTIHTVWDGFFQVIGYTGLLLYFLGPSVFAGIAAMLIIVPLNAIFLRKLSNYRAQNLKMTDKRVKLTNEVFQGIRAIKSYNWEDSFYEQLTTIRHEEMNTLKAGANTRSILTAMLSAAPSVVAVLTLGIYALLGNELTPVKVFTSLGLFNQLRFPLIFLPLLLNSLVEGRVSLNRLTKFLFADEIQNYVEKVENMDNKLSIQISNGTFAWVQKNMTISDDFDRGSLKNIDLEIKEGELVALVGPVGSGKTTLISAILGELNKVGGSVQVKGKVGYVSQTAWIPNETLRNVILFGKPFDENRYNEVIQNCGMKQDIESLDFGDATEIGERGINLSGGQKQRINLARAVYDDDDIYVMDDPLSALDSEVGAAVFRNCIKGSLKGKTRILATHQLNVLPEVDRIILMDKTDEGVCFVKDQGTFAELMRRGHDLSKVVKDSVDVNSDVTEQDSNVLPSTSAKAASIINDDSTCVDAIDNEPFVKSEHSETSDSSPSSVQTKAKTNKLVVDEERAEGTVSWNVYKTYLQAANKPLLVAVVLLSLFMANSAQQLQQWVVVVWTSDVGYVKRPLPVYLGGVAFMALGVAFFNWSRTYVSCLLGASASEVMHGKLTRNVLNAPLGFYESTPVGRLTQRFTRDLDQVDQQLPGSFSQLVSSTLSIISALAAIVFVTPSFAFIIIPVMLMYFNITAFYRGVARELKRLDSVTRSPVFAHFSETLNGLPIIRSFYKQNMFKRSNEVKLEDSQSAYFALKTVDRWLSVRLELLGNVIVFFSALLVVITKSRAGSSGLSLNNALSVTGLLNWAVRNGAETESLMNSVERLLYTTNETPQEAPSYMKSISPSAYANQTDVANKMTMAKLPSSDIELAEAGWPWHGGVSFQDVHMSYREGFDPVLRGVDIKIKPGESIGIVGRTGSGKSSLFRALMRLTEVDNGSIYIDGVNASNVGISLLRKNIAIIPQDPVLFSGSLRANLDPFQEIADEELWSALKCANLESTVRSLPGGLAYQVSEGGENFSLGQRQLICLARAVVRKSKILLLDEATSSIDYNTDTIIQKTIREEFGKQNCTILTIAHRLETVMDADRILVMDSGKVAEFDTPTNLLKNRRSIFYQLVAAEKEQQK